ncbi:vitrin isoform X2 [Falco biarmicus]|uniref:vitrin isoform X2 n=1 Tax=Falco cherrug TaxID=345164 RepID=UPI00247A700E|nr:vitrin isoform X2 [Falco cherrug]XP_055672012.1 vitrin isoform X2 [Falco peregrinus]XP_056212939.1 vitrin isoform X2 [Falco biarmicus]
MKATVIATFFGVLLMCTYAAKEATKKMKKSKLYVPQIDCDVKAGKIINPEFIAKCPPGCQDVKYRVYGTDIYASFSSVCNAAIHSGIIDNAGGKILVQKVAGHSGYRGSFSNGVRSLSLPRWRESFLVSEGKPRRGVTYPSALEYSSSKSTAVKSGDTVRKEYQTSPAPTPATQMATTTPTPTTTTTDPSTTTPKPTTTPTTTRTTTVASAAKTRPGLHRVRDIGSSSIHPAYSSVVAAASRQVQAAQGRGQNTAFRGTSTSASNRNILRPNTDHAGIQRQEPVAAFRRAAGSPAHLAMETDSWKSGLSLFDTGFSSKEELNPKPLESISQGNPNCKVDLSFLMDGSWSIGKRRFQLQKQFLSNMAQALSIGSAGPLMGIIQYGDDPSTEFNLNTYANSKDLRNAIEKISQKGGLSNVGKALSFVNKNFFLDANGNRGGAPNVVVVMVDGWPTDRVEEASRLARESGINIFFVTIEAAAESEKQNVIEPNFVDKAVCRTNGFYSINVPSWFSLHKVVQPLVKRVCDTDRLVCSKTCLNSADIGFVIDGSSSVGTSNFRTVLQFVANISKEFEISDTDTRIGAVQYTYEQRLEFSFDKYSTKQDVLSAIKRISYWSGGTSTGAAISYASEQLFSKSKPNKRKIMILITDGRSYDDVRVPAMAAHQNGVIAYSIGIAWAAQDELEAIATDPDKEHSFFVDEFDNLYRFVNQLIQNICIEFNSQPRN